MILFGASLMEQEICLLLTVTDICSSHIWDASYENKMAVKIVAKGWWKKACRDQTHKNWYISLIRNSDCCTYKPILNLGWRLNRVGYFELRNAWSTGSCRALCGYWWQRGSWSFICYFSVSVHYGTQSNIYHFFTLFHMYHTLYIDTTMMISTVATLL